MPAQRGTQVKWSGEFQFGNETLLKDPELGAIVASTIAGWAATEANMGRAFGSLIGAKQPVTMAIYSAIRSPEVQRDIMKTASREILPKRYAQMAVACIERIYSISKGRNRFAHWVWGISTDPNLRALLLVEPKDLWELHIKQTRYWNNKRGKLAITSQGPHAFNKNRPTINLRDIWIYRKRDLIEELEKINLAFRMTLVLQNMLVSNSNQRSHIYRWLASQPDLAVALDKVKKNWAKTPAIQPFQSGKRRLISETR